MERHNLHRFCFEHNLSGPQIFVDEHGKMRVFRPRIVISGGDDSGNDDVLYVMKQGNSENVAAEYRATPFRHNNHILYRYKFESTGTLKTENGIKKFLRTNEQSKDPFYNENICNEIRGLFSPNNPGRIFTYYVKKDATDGANHVTEVPLLSQTQVVLWIRKMVYDIKQHSRTENVMTQLGKGEITERTDHATVTADNSDSENQQTDGPTDQQTDGPTDQQTDGPTDQQTHGPTDQQTENTDSDEPDNSGNPDTKDSIITFAAAGSDNATLNLNEIISEMGL